MNQEKNLIQEYVEQKEQQEERIELWTIRGTFKRESTEKEKSQLYLNFFRSKKEAHAYALLHKSDIWVWDEEDPKPDTLEQALLKAKHNGYKGIIITSYDNGNLIDTTIDVQTFDF